MTAFYVSLVVTIPLLIMLGLVFRQERRERQERERRNADK